VRVASRLSIHCAAVCIEFGTHDARPDDVPFAPSSPQNVGSKEIQQVAEGLHRFHTALRILEDPRGGDIQEAFRRLLAPSGDEYLSILVYLRAPVTLDEDRHLVVVDRDGRRLQIDELIADVRKSEGTTPWVFILDLHGDSARDGALWSARASRVRRVRVLGGCTAASAGSASALGEATARTLHSLVQRAEHKPLAAEAIGFAQWCRELDAANGESGGAPLLRDFEVEHPDQGEGAGGSADWPFLPNPWSGAARPDGLRGVGKLKVVQGLLPELDVGTLISVLAPDALPPGVIIPGMSDGARSAVGRVLVRSDPGRSGLFTGRRAPLARMVRWLAQGDEPLLMISGGPGTGKSALLGTFLSAGNGYLHGDMRPVWRDVPGTEHLGDITSRKIIVAHAARRSPEDLVADILEQAKPKVWSPPIPGRPNFGNLREVLTRAHPRPDAVVIDGLDQSTDVPGAVEVIKALLPVASERPDRLGCRVLVAGRPDALALLRSKKAGVEVLIDLDAVSADVRWRDIADYLLEPPPGTAVDAEPRDGDHGALSPALAQRVARALLDASRSQPVCWGPYLLAGIAADYLRGLSNDTTDTAEAVKALESALAAEGSPGALEAALAAQAPRHPLLRPVLVALAHARGEGMPPSILRRAAVAFLPPNHDRISELTEEALDRTLTAAESYVHVGWDMEAGQWLYRLSQPSVAEYLRAHPYSEDAREEDQQAREARASMADRILPPPGQTTGVEPYLQRYALTHAADAGAVDVLLEDPAFWLWAEPWRDPSALRQAESPRARSHVASFHAGGLDQCRPDDAVARGTLMEYGAVLLNDTAARDRFAAAMRTLRTTSRWSPVWATRTGPPADAREPADPDGPDDPRDSHDSVALAYSPDGRLLATGGSDDAPEVRLWDAATGHPAGPPLTGHASGTSAAAFAPDGRILATLDGSGEVRLWSPATGAAIGSALTGRADPVAAIAFSPDGRRLAMLDRGEGVAVRLWNPATGAVVRLRPRSGGAGFSAVAFDPNGWILVADRRENTIDMWDASSGALGICSLEDAPDEIEACFSANGRVLATAGRNGVLHLWDPTTGRLAASMPAGHIRRIRALAFAPDGSMLATSADDHTVRFWDLRGRQLHSTLTFSRTVREIRFADREHVALAFGDGVAVFAWRQG
jgi:hypothetical protein